MTGERWQEDRERRAAMVIAAYPCPACGGPLEDASTAKDLESDHIGLRCPTCCDRMATFRPARPCR